MGGISYWKRARSAAVVVAVFAVLLAPSDAVAAPGPTIVWNQVGGDIDGEFERDEAGRSVAMSSDGTIVAVGAHLSDGNGSGSGDVRVFKFNGEERTQLGTDIDGASANDYAGRSVALSSDGSIVAIGSPGSDTNGRDSGHARVFQFDGVEWTQLGTDMDGESTEDEFGTSVALSRDGTVVAVGAQFNDGNGPDSGHVRVLRFDGVDWIQVGTDVEGEASLDNSGSFGAVALSDDANILAIGADRNDGNGTDSGHVRVLQFDGEDWAPLGSDIDGEFESDYSGRAISLSGDGTIVAIGAQWSDGNGRGAGQVRMFEFVGGEWSQLGNNIDGDAPFEQFGRSVALSNDGATVVVGVPVANGSGFRSGQVRVFGWDGLDWRQQGRSINGEVADDYFGRAVATSADGSVLIGSAPSNEGNGSKSGHARVFASSAHQPDSFDDGDVVLLRNDATGRYLDGDGVQRAWNVDTSPEPKWDAGWRLVAHDDGSWSLLNRRRARYLDADGDFFGFNVGQSVAIANDDRWQILDQDDGSYLLQNVALDRFLSEAANNKNVLTRAEPDPRSNWTIIELD